MTMPPLASIPMYDWPEMHAAYDAFWQALRLNIVERGLDAPEQLDRSRRYFENWSAPGLLFSQTCGYPLTHAYAGKLALLATPCYRAKGCDGPNYRSGIIVAKGSRLAQTLDFREALATVGSVESQSSYWALRAFAAGLPRPYGRPRAISISGGHRSSLSAVANGTADVAAIDAVCLAMAERYEPAAFAEVQIIGWSEAAPGLPFVTAADRPATEISILSEAVLATMRDPRLAALRDGLFLSDAVRLPITAYNRILEIEKLALAIDFPAPEQAT